VGAERPPTHAVVGLIAGRNDVDPIDEVLRRDAFQRAAIGLAGQIGGIVCGRVGGHGVVLLVDDSSKGARMQRKLFAIGDRARALARRFGLALHVGIADPNDDATLPARHRAALAAADKALTQGQPMAMADRERPRAIGPLGALRRELAKDIESSPDGLGPHFDRYLEVAGARSGQRLEPLKAYVEAAFDQVVDALQTTGALEERALEDLRVQLDVAGEARTIRDYLVACRAAVQDVRNAVSRPRQARRDRSVRRAAAFIRERLSESLSLSRVARVAGFEANYFSKLFAATEGVTLLHYVRQIRVERAKHMLETTSLAVEKIGQLCGFRSRANFHRAFHEVLRTTPGMYRSGTATAAGIVGKKR
jgi:AraC-like DNA-binding protein